MTQRPSIIVGCDGSPESETALDWAADYVRRANGSLHLLSCWEWPTLQGAPVTYGRWDPEGECKSRVARLRAWVDLPDDRVTADVVRGEPAHVLVRRAREAELLVVGTHGLSVVPRLLIGSVSAHCASHSPAPVAVVREAAGRRGVLVGVDGSESSRVALSWAMDYADVTQQPLTVIQTVEPSVEGHATTRRQMREIVEKEQAERGGPVEAGVRIRVLEGDPKDVLVEQSKRVAVTVVGRHGAGSLHRILAGSVASALTHHGHSTVVLTPRP